MHELRKAGIGVNKRELQRAVMFAVTGALHEEYGGIVEMQSPTVTVMVDGSQSEMSVEGVLLAGVNMSKILLSDKSAGSTRYTLFETATETAGLRLGDIKPVQAVLVWEGADEDEVDDTQRAILIANLLQGSANLA